MFSSIKAKIKAFRGRRNRAVLSAAAEKGAKALDIMLDGREWYGGICVNEEGDRPFIEVLVVDAFPGNLSIFIPPRIGAISVVVRFGTIKPERDAQKGAAAVEFALVLPLLCLTLFGSIDMGRMMFCRQQLAYVGAEGTRTASVISTATETDVKTHMIAAAPMLGLQQSDIVVTNATSATRGYAGRAMGDTLQIQTTYTFEPWFGFFSSLLKKTWVSTLTTPAQ
jgi:hypothetical protein